MSLSFLATACPIAMMTFTSPNLDAVESRYEEHLGYEVRDRGVISQPLADSWGAPAVGGRPYLLLGPESGARVYLRVVEGPAMPEDVSPLDTYGWTTAEIIGRDAYTLSASLKSSVPTVRHSICHRLTARSRAFRSPAQTRLLTRLS